MSARLRSAALVRSAQPTAYLHNRRLAYPISFGKSLAALFRVTDCRSLSVRQLGMRALLAKVSGPVAQTIGRIFSRRSPSKIRRSVVVPTPIVMRNMEVAHRGRRRQKSQSNKAVRIDAAAFAADKKPDVHIAPRIASCGADRAVQQAHAPIIGNFVARRNWYRSPFLHRGNIAHEQVNYKPGGWQ